MRVEARKKEIESEEHDPENFPEVPAAAEFPASEGAEAPAAEPSSAGEVAPAAETVAEAAPAPASPPAENPPAAT